MNDAPEAFQALGFIRCQTFARLDEKHIEHKPHDELDWVQSALVLLSYEVIGETRQRWLLIHNPKVGNLGGLDGGSQYLQRAEHISSWRDKKVAKIVHYAEPKFLADTSRRLLPPGWPFAICAAVCQTAAKT